MKKISAILLLAVLSVSFFFFFKNQSSLKKILLSSKNCQILQAPCSFKYRGQNLVSVEFAPSMVNNKSPFEVKIKLLDPNHVLVKKIHVTFQGIDMNLNAFYDLYSPDNQVFLTQARLPYCTLKKMSWKLLVNFTGALKDQTQKQFYIVHDFTVIN